MNGRVYDPAIGRFISADPITEAPYSSQSYNHYSYVGNNPLSFTDPSGYCFLGCFWQPKKALGLVGDAAEDVAHGVGHLADEVGSHWQEVAAMVAAYYTGGLSTAAFGTGFWGTVGTGAVIGGTYAGTDTALRGGNGSAILQNTLTGGAYGAVGGALSYGSMTYLGNGYASSVASGAVNGYLQTGSLRGAFLGGVSGFVPYDLGFSSAYKNSAWANFAIREGVAIIRGSIINGSLQGGLDEAGYVAGTQAAGFGFGFLSEFINGNARLPHFQKGAGAWFFTGARNFSAPLTIGSVVIGNGMPYGRTYYHELAHSSWQSAFGRNYLPVSILSVGLGAVTDIMTGVPVGHLPAWGAFAEHSPLQARSYSGGPCP